MKETAVAPSVSSGKSWLNNALHNKVIAAVLALIVAVPLFAAPADGSASGLAAFVLEATSLLLLGMIVWRSKWDLSPAQLRTFAKTSANVPLMLFVGWVAISAVLAPYKIFSMQYLLQIAAGAILYFAVAYQFRQSKHLSMLADVLLFLSGAVSVVGLASFQLNGELRASAIFGNYQPLASFTMLMLPVVVALAISDKNAARKTVAQIVSVMMVGCLAATQARSGWMGGIAGLAALAFLSTRVAERVQAKSVRAGSALPLKARKDQFVLPGLMAVMAVGFVFAMATQNDNLVARAGTFGSLGSDHSFMARVQGHWHAAMGMISAHPVAGTGAGSYALEQSKYMGGTVIAANAMGMRPSLAQQAHSFYLQTAAELGLVGLGLMLAVIGCFLVSAWKRIPQMEAGIRRTLLMASAAATVGFAVDAFASPSWQFAQISMFLWLILGVGTSCLRPRVRTESEAVVVGFQAPSRRVALFGRPAMVAAILAAAVLLPTAMSSASDNGYGNNHYKYVFDGVASVLVLEAGYYLINPGTASSAPVVGQTSTASAPPETTVQNVPAG